jgi:hypothetical protein
LRASVPSINAYRFASLASDATDHFDARLLGRKLRFVPAQRLADHFARILMSTARYLPVHERRQVIRQAAFRAAMRSSDRVAP